MLTVYNTDWKSEEQEFHPRFFDHPNFISSFLAEMLLQTTAISTGAASLTSPFQSTLCRSHHCCCSDKYLTQNAHFSFPKTVLPRLGKWFHVGNGSRSHIGHFRAITTRATMLETPVLWAGRLCIFYALLKAGLAGSPTNPLISDLESGADDFAFYDWFQALSKPEKEAAERRKLVSKWHPTTKGTLRRNYRIPSKSEGRRLLKAIASLLSDDDQFRDATSHKGCQIRRENAHGESVCCNNVRALFDELPTPHLIVEITAFPAGPLTENDYAKAERLERVLRSGPSV